MISLKHNILSVFKYKFIVNTIGLLHNHLNILRIQITIKRINKYTQNIQYKQKRNEKIHKAKQNNIIKTNMHNFT